MVVRPILQLTYSISTICYYYEATTGSHLLGRFLPIQETHTFLEDFRNLLASNDDRCAPSPHSKEGLVIFLLLYND